MQGEKSKKMMQLLWTKRVEYRESCRFQKERQYGEMDRDFILVSGCL